MHQAQHFSEDLDARAQRVFKQVALGGNQAVLLDGRGERVGEIFGQAGLGVEAEDIAVVDGGDGGRKVRLPGEHDAHGVGRDFLHLRQKIEAVHAGHLEIGNHHRVRPVIFDQGQGFFGFERALEVKLLAQLALER